MAICLRLRKVDHSCNVEADAAGKKTTVNLVHGQPLALKGPNLPRYTELYPGMVMAYVTALTPEGLLVTPKSKHDVARIMSTKIKS